MTTTTFDSMELLLVGNSEDPLRYRAAINICHSGRMALAARRTSEWKPIGQVQRMVPDGPDDALLLERAILVLCGSHFSDCPSYREAERALGDMELVDFNRKADVPDVLNKLMEEAMPAIGRLHVWQAALTPPALTV